MTVSEAIPNDTSALDPIELQFETLELIESVRALLTKHVKFTSEAQSLAVALFALNTYNFQVWSTTPYLAITSAEKRSGKSRLLEVLRLVVSNPWKTVKPTGPMLFRTIAELKPTVLLDEVDSTPKDKIADITDVLNSGFEEGTPVNRYRQNKDGDWERDEFDVYCPKVLAGIGKFLGDTTLDRCITVKLRRKLSEDDVSRFRVAKAKEATQVLRDRLAQWGPASKEALTHAEPELPDVLDDRAQDIWEPLLAVADLAGLGDQARQAAVELSGPKDQAQSDGTGLLKNIREVFAEGENVYDGRISSGDLVTTLTNREDWPWALILPAINQQAKTVLASMLAPFDIAPKKMRIRGEPVRGYLVGDFEDAWRRHLTNGEATPGTTGTPGTSQLSGL